MAVLQLGDFAFHFFFLTSGAYLSACNKKESNVEKCYVEFELTIWEDGATAQAT
jgi:hypothetical protein